jgi:hypothetical protein
VALICAAHQGKVLALDGKNVYESTSTSLAEVHLAVRSRKQRIVASALDIESGVKVRATLSDNDRSRRYQLAVRGLDSETLSV